MSRKSENSTTNQNSKSTKTIPEMTWDEILALPTKNVSDKKIAEFLKVEASRKKK